MPTTAMVRAVRSISSITAGSFMLLQLHELDDRCDLIDSHPSQVPTPGTLRLRSGRALRHPCPLHIHLVVRAGRNGCTAALGEEIAAQEGLKIAVEDLVHVAHFHL